MLRKKIKEHVVKKINEVTVTKLEEKISNNHGFATVPSPPFKIIRPFLKIVYPLPFHKLFSIIYVYAMKQMCCTCQRNIKELTISTGKFVSCICIIIHINLHALNTSFLTIKNIRKSVFRMFSGVIKRENRSVNRGFKL